VCRGNPHRVTGDVDRVTVVERFRADVHNGELADGVDDVRRELARRNLACWCRSTDRATPTCCSRRRPTSRRSVRRQPAGVQLDAAGAVSPRRSGDRAFINVDDAHEAGVVQDAVVGPALLSG
jgi:hypothetical protein